MKATEVKYYARLGQIAYWVCQVFSAFYEMQLPNYVRPELSGTFLELLYLTICLLSCIILSEVAVRIIGSLAELLEKN